MSIRFRSTFVSQAGIRGVYRFGQPLLIKWVQLQNPSNSTEQQHGQIVELARLQYYLNDPEFPQEFDAFLDSRSLEVTDHQSNTSQKRLDTPRAFIENAIVRYAREIEKINKGDVSIKVNIKRGSLGIDLAILGTVYANIALWHDFSDSISLVRDQVQWVIRKTSDLYREVTGRDVQVRTDIAVEAISATTRQRADELASATLPQNDTPAPVTVTNTGASPSATNTVNINLNRTSFVARFFSWLGGICFITVLIIATIYWLITNDYIHCQFLDDSNICYELSMEAAFRLSYFFGKVGRFFDQLAQSILP